MFDTQGRTWNRTRDLPKKGSSSLSCPPTTGPNADSGCCIVVVTLSRPWMSVGRLRDTVPVCCESCVHGDGVLAAGCGVCWMTGAQVCSVVRWLFGCSLVGLLVVLFVPLLLSSLAMPGLCCFLRVTTEASHGSPASAGHVPRYAAIKPPISESPSTTTVSTTIYARCPTAYTNVNVPPALQMATHPG